MRVRIDRVAEALRLDLADAPEAKRVEVVDGVALLYDAGERIVGVELRGLDPAAWQEFTVELGGLGDRPADGAAPRPAPSRPALAQQPQPVPFAGTLTWEPEAEAAVLQVPFFSRGRHRLAASALARQRGHDRVTAAVVRDVRL